MEFSIGGSGIRKGISFAHIFRETNLVLPCHWFLAFEKQKSVHHGILQKLIRTMLTDGAEQKEWNSGFEFVMTKKALPKLKTSYFGTKFGRCQGSNFVITIIITNFWSRVTKFRIFTIYIFLFRRMKRPFPVCVLEFWWCLIDQGNEQNRINYGVHYCELRLNVNWYENALDKENSRLDHKNAITFFDL